MKVLVTTHPGCHVSDQIIRRAIRFLAQYRKDVTLILLDPPDKAIKTMASVYSLPVLSVENLRKERGKVVSFLDLVFRVSDFSLALRMCDEVLMFWDGQTDTKSRILTARKVGKTVTVARTDGKYPIVPCGVGV